MTNTNLVAEKFALLIPAAGNSSRMGRSKALLQLPSGKLILESIVDAYRDFGIENIIATLNPSGYEELKTLRPDVERSITLILTNEDGKGSRFQSIRAGIQACASVDAVFIHNVDNPFVFLDILQNLVNQLEISAYTVPEYQNHGGHPILVDRGICEAVLTEKSADINFREILHRFQRIAVQCSQPGVLANINNEEEWKRWF